MNILNWIKKSDQRIEEALKQAEGYNASPNLDGISSEEVSKVIQWDKIVGTQMTQEGVVSAQILDAFPDDKDACVNFKRRAAK